jgi:hypothetical protein
MYSNVSPGRTTSAARLGDIAAVELDQFQSSYVVLDCERPSKLEQVFIISHTGTIDPR